MARARNFYFEAQQQGQLWEPSYIRCGLWLDAADTSTIALSAGVSQWSDKSRNNNNLAQNSGINQPSYRANLQLASVKQRHSISFDGSNDFIFKNGGVAGVAGADLWVFLAITYRNNTTLLQSVFGTDVSSTAPFLYLQADGANLKGYGGNYVSAGSIITNVPEITVLQRGPLATDNLNVFRNGVLAGTGVVGGATVNDGIIFGRLGTGTFGSFASVDISECIAVVGSTNRQVIEGYLAWKWDLPLPATHPFINRPPLIGD